RYQIRFVSFLLTLGTAGFSISSDITVIRAQNANLAIQSATTTLLQEFKTAKYFWQQAEVGEKLIALNDRSIVPVMLELLGSESRAERCNAGRVSISSRHNYHVGRRSSHKVSSPVRLENIATQ